MLLIVILAESPLYIHSHQKLTGVTFISNVLIIMLSYKKKKQALQVHFKNTSEEPTFMLECVHFLLSMLMRCMSISEQIRNWDMRPRGALALKGQLVLCTGSGE